MRVGIVGAGGMGNVHARHYKTIGGIELFVFDTLSDRAQQFADVHSIHLSDSFDSLVSSVDAVDLCVPTDFHPECALKAIAAGRHVLVEKPIAGNLDAAAAMTKAADAAGVLLMVGQVVRYFPEFRKGHDLVVSGAVGTPAAARMRRGGGPPRAEWFLDHSRSGGVLVDLAVHDFDWLRWTLGEVKCLYSRSVGVARGGHGVDYALTTLTFDSGAVAHVESTWMDPSGFRVTYEVCGSGGMIEYDSRLTASLRTHSAGGTRLESPLAASDDPYFNQLRDFVAACRGEKSDSVTAYDGFMSLSISLAAVESAKTGRVVAPARAL